MCTYSHYVNLILSNINQEKNKQKKVNSGKEYEFRNNI